jgi:hypothetical protein
VTWKGSSGQSQFLSTGKSFKKEFRARHWWFMSIILATQEAEIRRIAV